MSKHSGRLEATSEAPYNPYAPPRRSRQKRGPGFDRRRWAEGAGRAAAVVVGFSLVADPTALPIGGHVFARGVGLALLGVGFLPWRGGVRGRAGGGPAGPDREEL